MSQQSQLLTKGSCLSNLSEMEEEVNWAISTAKTFSWQEWSGHKAAMTKISRCQEGFREQSFPFYRGYQTAHIKETHNSLLFEEHHSAVGHAEMSPVVLLSVPWSCSTIKRAFCSAPRRGCPLPNKPIPPALLLGLPI